MVLSIFVFELIFNRKISTFNDYSIYIYIYMEKPIHVD